MKAIVYREYGGPDVLHIEEVDTPVPSPSQVRVRVHATTVSTAETAMRKGDPLFARVPTGLRRPRRATIPGSELAGVVDVIGAEVTRFAPGDRVVASTGAALGASAEAVCVEQDGAIAPIPDAVSFEDAVAVCEGGLTALPFLRDGGRVAAGMTVLVNGASGAVGSAAVQLAKHEGARVTGVAGAPNAELVRSLGADAFIDYAVEDFTASDDRYDIVFDVVGKSSFSRCRRVLRPGGAYLRTVPSIPIIAQMLATSRLTSRRAVLMLTGLRKPAAKAKDLHVLMDLAARGELRAVVSRTFALAESVDAHRFVERGPKQGSVVMTA